MRNTAFIKITAVYGQIDENWEFVRKWSSRKVPITDKMVKNNLLSVKFEWNLGAPPRIRKNSRHHGTDFNHYSVVRGLSVRLHALSKSGSSSPSVAQSLRTGSWPFGSTPCLNQVQTSNKAHDKFMPRRDCACADHSRPSLSTALLSGWSSHLVLDRSNYQISWLQRKNW